MNPDPRITQAAERTFLAWIRTGIALMGFGFIVARFGVLFHELVVFCEGRVVPPHDTTWVGTFMIVLGVLVNVVATIRHWRTIDALLRGAPIVPERKFPTMVALGTAIIGVVLIGTLTASLMR